MLVHNSLGEYYKQIFALCQHHKYSISDVESLMPYERDVYFAMLIDWIEKQKEKKYFLY